MARARRAHIAHEHDPSANFIGRFALHIESQIDLFKVAMARRRDTEQAALLKYKTHHAQIGTSVVQIEHRAPWHAGLENLGRDHIIQHQQVAPFGA